MWTLKGNTPDTVAPERSSFSKGFRIAVPSFGLLGEAVASMGARPKISREEILDIFCDRLRPGQKPNPGYTEAEAQETDQSRRVRNALYPDR